MQAISCRRTVGVLGLALLWLGCVGCYRPPSGPVRRGDVIGNYVFSMDDSGAPYHGRDRLTLKADGRYLLTRVTAGRPGPVERGTWSIDNKFEPSVDFAGRGYPVEIRGKQLRLVVNDDLGYYWYKVAK